MNENNPTLTLTVTLETLKVIFAGLDELPAKYSRGILADLDKQAMEQLSPPEKSQSSE
jgi:hypothetical protein